jgi:hypothetical protein
MGALQNRCGLLSKAYRKRIRPEIEKWTPERLAALDSQFDRLNGLAAAVDQPVRFALLGAAAAGKSSLLNAIAFRGQSILPAGGVGALTAQATRIVYSETPYFEVHYSARRTLTQTAYALRRVLKLETVSVSDGDEETQDDSADIIAGLEAVDSGREERKQNEKRAALLVKGTQDAATDVSELLFAIEHALGRPESSDASNLADADLVRIGHLVRIMKEFPQKEQRPYRRNGTWDDGDFRQDLRNHAAGFLSPLVRDLVVGYPWELFDNHLELIDLPGIGVSGDSYVSVTEGFIREKAHAIILVVNRSGIEESGRKLLEDSGFLQRLVYSADHPEEDPLLLFVVATKVDEPVKSKVREARQVGETVDVGEVLKETRSELIALLEHQLHTELGQIADSRSGAGQDMARRAVDQVTETASYHAVSSTQYALHHDADEFEVAFIKNEDESGIPDLNLELSGAIESFEKRRFSALATSLRLIEDELEQWCQATETRYLSTDFAEEEVRRIQLALRDELAPLLKEVQARLGSFREFLTGSLPKAIEMILAEASIAAGDDIRRYLRRLGDMHWASLRAAVRKGGTHFGTNVVLLPKTFADHLETQIAPLWQKEVIGPLVDRIGQLANDLSEVVGEMSVWAKANGLSEGDARTQAMAEQMGEDIRQLRTFIDSAGEGLRAAVRSQLYQAIRQPVGDACRKFVEANHDVGRGTKRRILDCFDDLVTPALKTACTEAKKVLSKAIATQSGSVRDRLRPYTKLQDELERRLLPAIGAHQQSEYRRLQPEAESSVESVKQAIQSCPLVDEGLPATSHSEVA